MHSDRLLLSLLTLLRLLLPNPSASSSFVFMPFGLRNVAQSFQQFITQALGGLLSCYVDIDDILVTSQGTPIPSLPIFHTAPGLWLPDASRQVFIWFPAAISLRHWVLVASIQLMEEKVEANKEFHTPYHHGNRVPGHQLLSPLHRTLREHPSFPRYR